MLADILAGHLRARDWGRGQCTTCGAAFLAPTQRERCGRSSCSTPGSADARPDLPRRLVFWDDIWPKVAATVTSAGFATTGRSDLVNHVGGTRFVGAGLQIFEPAMYAGAEVPRGRLFVPQPAIRLNYLDAVSHSDGFSTAFLNLCTEQALGDVGEYLSHVDAWLDCLQAVGAPARETTLLLPSAVWSGGPFRGHAAVAIVSGVEVGDILFIDGGEQEVLQLLPIVDTSFGLERLVSACNGGVGYSSLLGPLPMSTVSDLRVPIDRLRTATLMLMAGLTPSGRGRGRILRSLVSVATPLRHALDVDAVIAHAYAYWSAFHRPVVDLQWCQSLIRGERDRSIKRALLGAAGWRTQAVDSATTMDELCRHLLRSGLSESILARASAQPVRRYRERRPASPDPRSTLTIVTPTSPIPAHPSTGQIRRAIRSLVHRAGLARCRQLIVCDGHPDGPNSSTVAYKEYKQRLRALADHDDFGTDAEVIELDRCVGLGGVMRAAIEHVRTPYLLTYEHDWRLARSVDSSSVLALFSQYRDVHYVRLNKRRTHETGWDSVLKPDDRERHLPLVRTGCWSSNPHFARTSHYRRLVVPHLREQPGGGSEGFEHPVFYAYQADIHRLGFDRAQQRWGVFILGDIGDTAAVAHLDGRRSSPGGSVRNSTPGGASSS